MVIDLRNKEHYTLKRLDCNEKGSVLSVELLVILPLVIFIIFAVIDYWMVMVKIQQAEHIKNYYLDRIRLEGCLTESDAILLVNMLYDNGLSLVTIEAPIESDYTISGADMSKCSVGIVSRNTKISDSSDIASSEVYLKMKLKSQESSFVYSILIGQNSEKVEFSVAGRALSEKVI